MPKYLPATAKAKAKRLTKSYSECGLNQSKVARKEGVTPSAINQRLKKAPVQATMAELMDKAGLTDAVLARKLKEGANAKEIKYFAHEGEVTDEREVIDHNTRHRYVTTALEVKKHIRAEEDAKPMKLVIEYGHRRPKTDG